VRQYFAGMSQENIELVRRAGALVGESCRTGEASDALLDLCAPDIRVDASRRVFNPDVYDGPDGLRRMVREIHDAWEGFTERVEQLLDAGERVVSLHTISGRGRSSGVEVESAGALIWTVRDGRVRSVEVFADRAEALRAAGLEQGEAAAQPNGEVVRRFLEHINTQELKVALSYVSPEAALDWTDSPAPDSGVYRGPEGWGRWMAGRAEGLADSRFEVAELIEVPPDTVVLVAYMSGRGRASGLETRALGAGVCTVSDGRLTGLTLYQSREEALRALGLEDLG
jgi:uncharacterized protein